MTPSPPGEICLPYAEYEALKAGHRLHIRTSEEGDWVELSVDGKKVFEGHSFAYCFLDELLEPFGWTVTSEEIPGEEFL